MYGLKTEASFDSAHFLTDYYGKCENLHGHRWRAVVYLEVADLQADGTMKDMVLISACSSARCAIWPKSWTTPSSWRRDRWLTPRWPHLKPRVSI